MNLTGLFANLLQAAQQIESSPAEDKIFAVQWGVVIGASLVAALWDLRERRIPNKLTFPLLLAGLAWRTWIAGGSGFVDATLGCLIVALPFVVLFVYAGGGAGDAKMMGALGAWLGVWHGLLVLTAVVFAGALLGLGYAATQKKFGQVIGHMKFISTKWFMRISGIMPKGSSVLALPEEAELTEMPYALSILCGVCVAAIGAMVWQA